jgi:hypothetical protein
LPRQFKAQRPKDFNKRHAIVFGRVLANKPELNRPSIFLNNRISPEKLHIL